MAGFPGTYKITSATNPSLVGRDINITPGVSANSYELRIDTPIGSRLWIFVSSPASDELKDGMDAIGGSRKLDVTGSGPPEALQYAKITGTTHAPHVLPPNHPNSNHIVEWVAEDQP